MDALLSKKLEIDGVAMTIFSIDAGRTWSSSVSDLHSFAGRRKKAVEYTAGLFAKIGENWGMQKRAQR